MSLKCALSEHIQVGKMNFISNEEIYIVLYDNKMKQKTKGQITRFYTA